MNPCVLFALIASDFFDSSGRMPQCAVSTQSVDLTITNILDGHVTFTPLPNLQELAEGVEERERASQLKGGSELFRGPNPKSVHLSQQRQMSLEERKVLLLEQARR